MATKGYTEYTKKFGTDFESWRSLPWQAMPAYGADWPMSFEDDEVIGELLMQCAAENKEATGKMVVDLMYLIDDTYISDEHNVEAKTYDEFIEKMSRLHILV